MLPSAYESNRNYCATWLPIYLEPIALSGERITAVIAALGDDGEVCAHPVLSAAILARLFGDNGCRLDDMIALQCESLTAHLTDRRTFDGWHPVLSGFFIGDARPARSKDLAGVIKQAIRLTASVGSVESHINFRIGGGNMDKTTQLFIRACKQEDAYTRLHSVYRRFYCNKFEVDFYIAGILARICDEYVGLSVADILSAYHPQSTLRNDNSEDYWTLSVRFLAARIGNTNNSKFTGLRLPLRVRHLR